MNFKFSGINISSKSPHEVFLFYKKLGLKVLEEVPEDDKWYGAALALWENSEEAKLWIWRQGENEESKVRNHLVFEAKESLDKIYENIIKSGIKCEPPFTAAWGGKELILYDPEGNEILFL